MNDATQGDLCENQLGIRGGPGFETIFVKSRVGLTIRHGLAA
jgi:hypothetical protein